ncbi:3-oxoacyl-ACP synthase III family protein [Paenibacillus gorillae]|uniref:3-oxoacyl-ACP synthase III family protein n=1 Tax=Paenibacillus gorillae TaxID=1243662 RepID=UPI0004B8DFAA|nr:ketoacyl-ACP synthase III [Paenibacillus gorillae]
MAISNISNVSIKGISCALPRHKYDVEQFSDVFSQKDIKKVTNMVGTKYFYRTDETQTTADLCVSAAEILIEKLSWDRNEIDGIIFVTQTPDYLLPATSGIIQHRLGLPETCLTLDISLGCSGYVYGLMTASQFVSTGSCKKMLVLVGDTISKIISERDRSVAFLFGDAGTATALEYDATAGNITFTSGSRGSGEKNLIVPVSGFRNRRNHTSSLKVPDKDGNLRSKEELFMNGSEIFNFTIEKVPPLINETIESHGWTLDDPDYYIFHQANKYMINYLSQKIGVEKSKVPINIEKFGNTSSASIPLVLVDFLGEKLKDNSTKVCLAGFGVGYSWAGAAIDLKNVICPEIQYI